MNIRVGALVVLAGAVLMGGGEAEAQTLAPELRIGAGYHYFWYPERAENAIGLRASARFPVSSSVSLEPELTFGHASTTRRYESGTTHARVDSWSLGLNVIYSIDRGRVRPYFGGGAGVLGRWQEFETVIDSGPHAGTFPLFTSSGPFISGQALAGIDVGVAKRTALFGEFRVNALVASSGAVGFWYLGGVRVALR
jgi:hypothetical protein